VPTPFLNPNPFHPFPTEETRQQADLAATAIVNRYVLANRAMQALPEGADNRTAAEAFHELANAAHDLHRVLMLGWWSDQPF
jgi:hypothetical protein